MPEGLYMFKNPFKRSKSMATEHNQEAQDLGQEQADSQTAQTQAETEQAEVSVEDLQAQITNDFSHLDDSSKIFAMFLLVIRYESRSIFFK
jgi:hypothetical protein